MAFMMAAILVIGNSPVKYGNNVDLPIWNGCPQLVVLIYEVNLQLTFIYVGRCQTSDTA